MKFSILICTANRFKELETCVSSVNNQIYNSFEIIIVDQSDEILSEEMQLQLKNCKYIHTPIKGLSRARNIGISHASGEYICILDDDAEYEEDFLHKIYDLIQEYNDKIDIFCGKVVDKKTGELFSSGMKNENVDINYSNVMEMCVSTTLVIKKDIIDLIGNFDELLGVGAKFGAGEESDFLIRALKNNFIVKYFFDLIVYHPAPNINIDQAALKKMYYYGLGQGALDYKNLCIYKTNEILIKDLKMLIRTFLGFFKYMFIDYKVSKARIRYFYGAINGFMGYGRQIKEYKK